MKTALAIVFTLLLAWTQPVPAHAAAASEARLARACCGCGSNCCAAKTPKPESQPVSAAPVSSFPVSPLTLAPGVWVWTLPAAEGRELSPSFFSPLQTAGPPLYTRNCAWLI